MRAHRVQTGPVVTWSYRVVRRRRPESDEDDLAIFNTYYDDHGDIDALTVAVAPSGHDLASLAADFDRMRQALGDPVLDYDDIVKPPKRS
jgi:hypothetical protein